MSSKIYVNLDYLRVDLVKPIQKPLTTYQFIVDFIKVG